MSDELARGPDGRMHRAGCEALGGYGHGIGPCSCGATGTVRDPGAGLPPDVAELVKRLRSLSVDHYGVRHDPGDDAIAMQQAADTIERLARELAAANQRAENWKARWEEVCDRS